MKAILILGLSFVFTLLCGLAALRSYAQPSDAGAGSAVVALDAGAGSGSAVTPAPATGSGSAIAPLPQAGGVADPLEAPAAAYSEWQIARKTGWPLAVLLLLVMLTHGMAQLETTSIGAWLAVGTRASIISVAGTMIAAAYNAFLSGGSLAAAMIAASGSFFLLKNARPKTSPIPASSPAK